MSPQLRERIEQAIERLLMILDDFDGDENTEDDGCAEPVLGWTVTMAHGDRNDLEHENFAA